MFGLFKKKPTQDDSIAYCQRIANQAVIEPVLEAGLYSGFLIRVPVDSKELGGHFACQEARSLFVEIIEVRIAEGEFEQLVANSGALGLQPNENDGRETALRALIGRNDAPLLSWRLPQQDALVSTARQ